ncbi:MAG: hypothetical protein FWC01_01120 [Treponema sp.]|nr:hypothetical protein [Treponema sp.]MCL2236787.1 hypothetical protein [Treponema sp.]
MNQDEKLEKVCKDFSMLNDDQQDYILGIMNALVFAKSMAEKGDLDAVPETNGG